MIDSLRSRLFAFAFVTTHRTVGGVSYGRILRVGLFIFIIAALLFLRWRLAVVLFVSWLLVLLLYRRAKKQGYATFTRDTTPFSSDLLPLKPDEKVDVRVTGRVSDSERELDVLLRKGKIWRTALHEYALMVDLPAGRYLYQFIQPEHIQNIDSGQLKFAQDRFNGVRIRYRTDWSPSLLNNSLAYYVGGGPNDQRLALILYLTFDEADDSARGRLIHSLIESKKGRP